MKMTHGLMAYKANHYDQCSKERSHNLLFYKGMDIKSKSNKYLSYKLDLILLALYYTLGININYVCHSRTCGNLKCLAFHLKMTIKSIT